MSATNRGSERVANDFYATAIPVIKDLLDHIDLNNYGGGILEPSAGNGNFLDVINNTYNNKNITAIEIREEEFEGLQQKSNKVIIGDFLDDEIITDKFDVIIGNPPYNKAKEFVEKSLSLLNDEGVLIFLLRTAFLESKSRYDFWQENPLSKLYTLSKRPSFVGNKTDATSYSWFIWDKKNKGQEIKTIKGYKE